MHGEVIVRELCRVDSSLRHRRAASSCDLVGLLVFRRCCKHSRLTFDYHFEETGSGAKSRM